MIHRVKLGTKESGTSVTPDRGYSLRDVHDEPSRSAEGESAGGSLDKYLNYALVGMVLVIVLIGVVNLVVAGSPRSGSIVRQIERENALSGPWSDAEKSEIMRQAQRFDRADALGNTAQARRELERLLMLGNGNADTALHKLCVDRLRYFK